MIGEKQQSWCKIHQKVAEVEIKNLYFKEEICYCHFLTLVLLHLLLHLLERELTSIYPSFALTHQPIYRFHRIDLCIGIRHKYDVTLVLVDTHTQNSVLG